MSETKLTEGTERKELYLEDIQAQVQASEQSLARLQQQLIQTQGSIQQEVGILNHARHLLSSYNLPSRAIKEPAKETVEVK